MSWVSLVCRSGYTEGMDKLARIVIRMAMIWRRQPSRQRMILSFIMLGAAALGALLKAYGH